MNLKLFLYSILLVLASIFSVQAQNTDLFVAEYNYVASTSSPGAGQFGMNGLFLDSDGLGFTVNDIIVDSTFFTDSGGMKFLVKSKNGSSPLQLGIDPVGHASTPNTGIGQLYNGTKNFAFSLESGAVTGKLQSTNERVTRVLVDSLLGVGSSSSLWEEANQGLKSKRDSTFIDGYVDHAPNTYVSGTNLLGDLDSLENAVVVGSNILPALTSNQKLRNTVLMGDSILTNTTSANTTHQFFMGDGAGYTYATQGSVGNNFVFGKNALRGGSGLAQRNVAIGEEAAYSPNGTVGANAGNCIAIGYRALYGADYFSSNIAIGAQAGENNKYFRTASIGDNTSPFKDDQIVLGLFNDRFGSLHFEPAELSVNPSHNIFFGVLTSSRYYTTEQNTGRFSTTANTLPPTGIRFSAGDTINAIAPSMSFATGNWNEVIPVVSGGNLNNVNLNTGGFSFTTGNSNLGNSGGFNVATGNNEDATSVAGNIEFSTAGNYLIDLKQNLNAADPDPIFQITGHKGTSSTKNTYVSLESDATQPTLTFDKIKLQANLENEEFVFEGLPNGGYAGGKLLFSGFGSDPFIDNHIIGLVGNDGEVDAEDFPATSIFLKAGDSNTEELDAADVTLVAGKNANENATDGEIRLRAAGAITNFVDKPLVAAHPDPVWRIRGQKRNETQFRDFVRFESSNNPTWTFDEVGLIINDLPTSSSSTALVINPDNTIGINSSLGGGTSSPFLSNDDLTIAGSTAEFRLLDNSANLMTALSYVEGDGIEFADNLGRLEINSLFTESGATVSPKQPTIQFNQPTSRTEIAKDGIGSIPGQLLRFDAHNSGTNTQGKITLSTRFATGSVNTGGILIEAGTTGTGTVGDLVLFAGQSNTRQKSAKLKLATYNRTEVVLGAPSGGTGNTDFVVGYEDPFTGGDIANPFLSVERVSNTQGKLTIADSEVFVEDLTENTTSTKFAVLGSNDKLHYKNVNDPKEDIVVEISYDNIPAGASFSRERGYITDDFTGGSYYLEGISWVRHGNTTSLSTAAPNGAFNARVVHGVSSSTVISGTDYDAGSASVGGGAVDNSIPYGTNIFAIEVTQNAATNMEGVTVRLRFRKR